MVLQLWLIASSDGVGVGGRVAGFIALLASFNLAIAVFNLVPLLPFDGGHIAIAVYEKIRNIIRSARGMVAAAPVRLRYAVAVRLAGTRTPPQSKKVDGRSRLSAMASTVRPRRFLGRRGS